MAPDTSAELLVATVSALSSRAPAVVAAAAGHLRDVRLGLRFGDGSRAHLEARESRLFATVGNGEVPQVEVYFDDRALNLLFDLERRPSEQVLERSLDVRGDRDQVLQVWRTFQLLSQRASGLRAIQALWRAYRDRTPERWGRPAVVPEHGNGHARNGHPRNGSRWSALEWLDGRLVADAPEEPVVGGTVHAAPRELWDGRSSSSWWDPLRPFDADLQETLSSCKRRVREELARIVPDREPRAALYDLMRDYPSREGKGLRPTLTLATCAAFGGRSEDAVLAAAAIELFHNGFLVHDDIADESTHRRGLETLHTAHGVGLAVNAGDAMNLLAIDTVLSNLQPLGLARTLGLIHEILHMCRETVEGQAIELGWIHEVVIPPGDEDYFVMSTKKTGWYTCISPCRMGAVCAGITDPESLARFDEAFRQIGIAFQIQDDVLNLIGEESLYGKEPLGDLLEGKRTVMLIHLFRESDDDGKAWLIDLLRRPRSARSFADAQSILAAMERVGSIAYATALADRLAHGGLRSFEADLAWIPENEGKAVLRQIATYVTTRPL